ncbi:putative 4-nitrophenylphosphatase [Tieghemostelium lacteum]|uniref:Putative 4-nitrophenylphosphatase n=1 Tax=Tieghemostelium lacteum TaxID=361077 RepID=A0A151ZEE8_TIELA|nr:putative 4-nitrophenylphosphatase [Tieghemostelium lacteum]|eukprot:KYQ92264.1 putative 4-nitrophenylphosphatase [Tieghemostelium lacteum]
MISNKNTATSLDLNIGLRDDVIKSIKTFIFDADGVLFNTTKPVEGAAETLKSLRALGKNIRFVTNNSTKTRQQFLDKLVGMGFECYIDEVYGSSYGAGYYLKSIKYDKKVFIIGEQGLEKELLSQDIKIVKYEDTVNFTAIKPGIENVEHIEIDNEIGAVVMGMDTAISYQKLVYGHKVLVENKDTMFIATNTDATYPVKNNKTLIGSGSLLAILINSTGRQPVVIGKPEPLLLDLIIERDQLKREETCMIGDRLDTDILFGIRGNIKTMLVYTGIEKEQSILDRKKNAESDSNLYLPNYTISSIGNLFQK